MEIDYYVFTAEHGQRFDRNEFVTRVAARAKVDENDAAFYGQAVADEESRKADTTVTLVR